MTKRLRLLLHLTAGGGLVLIATLLDYTLGYEPKWSSMEITVSIIGLGIILLGSCLAGDSSLAYHRVSVWL